MKKHIQFIYTHSLAWYGARLAMAMLANYALDYEIVPSTVNKVVPATGQDAILFSFLSDREMYKIFKSLELAKIPNLSKDRSDSDPIVVAGGAAMFQPEPIAHMVDVMCVGDGEEFLMGFNRAMKASTRQARIDALAELPGAYVPGRRNIVYDKSGFFVKDMTGETEPVIPHVTSLWESAPAFQGKVPQVEISRGCNKDCAFCSITWRNPFRERSYESTKDEVMKKGGAVSYLSPNMGGVSYFQDIHDNREHGQNGEITVDDFLALPYPKKGEYSGHTFTFGMEGLTPHLRRIVGKPISDEKVDALFERLFYGEALRLKLYFIRNIPGETIESWKEWADWYRKIKTQWRENGLHVNLQFTPLTKQAHTPFQWFSHKYNEDGEKYMLELRDQAGVEWNENKHIEGFTQIWFTPSRLKASWLIDNITNMAGRDNGMKFLWAQHTGKLKNLHGMKYVGEGYNRVKRIAKATGTDVDVILGDIPLDANLPWSHIKPMGDEGIERTKKFARSIKRRI